MSVARAHVYVSGMVQGVGYRYFVIDAARAHHVTGWVRNLSDGRVEAEIEGPSEAVERMIELLREGPRFSRVDDLEVTREEGEAVHESFQVR